MTSHYDPEAEPAIWRIPDALWAEIQPLLPPEKARGTPGRPVVPFRTVLDGILHVLRTGCHWKAVPKEFGSGSTCHRRFQEWVANGTWRRLWADQLERYDAEHGIGWDWQSADSAIVPSPPGGRRDWSRPDQPGQTGHQAAHPDRSPWGALGRRPQWGQPHRHEGGRGDLGQRGGGPPPAHTAAPAALVPGQGL
jgi:transposase